MLFDATLFFIGGAKMRGISLLLYSLIALLTASAPASAGVFMCNGTSQIVWTAIGYEKSSHWISEGWWKFSPNECKALQLGVPENRNFYYYAHSEGRKSVWGGEGRADAGYFCADDSKFTYNSDSNNCAGYKFRKVDLGDSQQYTFFITESSDPKAAALRCRSEIAEGKDAFAKCWMRGMATEKQAEILNCWDKTNTYASFAICASKDQMSKQQLQIADCASKYNQDKIVANFADCMAQGNLSDQNRKLINCALRNDRAYDVMSCAALGSLSSGQRRMVDCVAKNKDSYVNIGVCLASDQLSPDQRRVANCVMKNTSYMSMGVCAAGSNLTPEQQVFAECAIRTGGQPYAFAGCVGTQLTLNELQKCLTSGIGGSGCFGDNNTAVKFVQNAYKDITEGPGPSNDLLGRDGWVGRTIDNAAGDLQYGPGASNDIVGKDGFMCQTFFGGC